MIKKQIIIMMILSLMLISCAHINSKKEESVTAIYSMGFINKSDVIMEYILYQLDHPDTINTDEVVEVSNGKLLPGESDITDMPEGEYFVGWFEEGDSTLIDDTHFRHFAPTAFIFR